MTIRSFSTLLDNLATRLDGGDDRVLVDTLLEGFHERGFGVAIALFALPMAIPIPKPPGLSTVFGLPLLILTLQQALGRHTLWMPGMIRRRTLARDGLVRCFRGMIPWLRRVEILLKPRCEWATAGLLSRLTGFLGVIMSLCIMVPLPGTNTVTGFGMGVMALGLIARDGLAVMAGAVIGTGWAALILTLYAFFGMEALNVLRNLL